ncbi:hypothetical protein GF318_04350 [Candidatus Micrarchaeota archaeon]|nr:hypothetical protein [Candidatus Micrarchaeota archaeon]
MRLLIFGKLIVVTICISLLAFALLPEATIVSTLKMLALGTVASVAITAFYPDLRGVRSGDTVAVVTDSAIPGIIGRIGWAVDNGRKNEQIKITLQNGSEVLGVIESYNGLISPPKIRVIYEEKLVD